MAYLDLTVAPTSILSGSSAKAAGYPLGTDGAPIYSCPCTITAGYLQIVHDDDVNGWAGTNVGHCIVVTVGGVSYWRVVTSVADVANHNIEVDTALPAGTGDAVVGGAVRSPDVMIDLVGRGHGASGWPLNIWDSPRILIRYASYSLSASITATMIGTWSASVPLQVIGCDGSGGVLDWRTTNYRSVFDWGTTSRAFNLLIASDSSHTYILWSNLVFQGNSAGYAVLGGGSSSQGHFYNCQFLAVSTHTYRVITSFYRGTMHRCLISRAANGTEILIEVYTLSSLIYCHVVGPGNASATNNPGVALRDGGKFIGGTITKCGPGVVGGSGGALRGATVYNNSGPGVRLDYSYVNVTDNVIAHNGTYAISTNSASLFRAIGVRNNVIGAHPSGYFGPNVAPMQDNILLASDADLFEDYAADPKDLRIKATSAAYGVRHDLPSGLDADASFLDAGAIQRLRSSGGGAAQLIGSSLIGSGIR
jgi:hypothetical protein